MDGLILSGKKSVKTLKFLVIFLVFMNKGAVIFFLLQNHFLDQNRTIFFLNCTMDDF